MALRNRRSPIFKLDNELSIRERLGILQEDWAAFCGISKSLLGMIEIGQRSWPVSKGKTDLPLLLAYALSQQEPVDLSHVEENLRGLSKLETRLLEIKLERYRKEKELRKMQFLLKTGRNLLQTCHRLRQDNPDLAKQKLDYIDLWERNALDRIHKNHEDLQQLVKLSLKHLLEEEELILKTLERNQKK